MTANDIAFDALRRTTHCKDRTRVLPHEVKEAARRGGVTDEEMIVEALRLALDAHTRLRSPGA